MDREKMRLRLDVNNMMDTFVGEHGISQAELEAVSGKAREAFESFQANRGTGMTGWSELPYNQAGVSMPDYRAALVVKALEIEYNIFNV